MGAALTEHSVYRGSCGMNISPEHRVLNEQERLVAASRLFEDSLDRLDKFVPVQSTTAQTAMKKARRAAAALPEVARDTANAVKMGAAWHRREKTLKYAANTSGPVLADLTILVSIAQRVRTATRTGMNPMPTVLECCAVMMPMHRRTKCHF